MANLKYGSTGDDVKELQQKLQDAGYDVGSAGIDGIYGSDTAAAVKKYQNDKGLAGSGDADDETLGYLYGTNKAATPQQSNQMTQQTEKPAAYESAFTYEPYEKSDIVLQAEALLQQQLAQKPGEYQSQWQAHIDSILGQLQNREDFSYDVNADALYQQMKDIYTRQGQMAMMDTMGQAAALTGGYGNSYAQTVGQQVYQGYLQELTDQVPELQQMAYDRYLQEGQDLYDQLGLYMGMDELDYGRHQDDLAAYYTELDRLNEDARYKAEDEYGKWADQVGLDYGMYRDQVADEQWQAEFDEAKRQYDQAYALQTGGSSSSSSGKGGKGGGDDTGDNDPGNTYTANPGWSEEKIRAFQKAHRLTEDGIWGPNTAAAYDKDPNWVWDGGNGGGTESVQELLDDIVASGTLASGKTVDKNTREGQQALKRDINLVISEAVASGEITQAEANRLRQIYTSPGNTY